MSRVLNLTPAILRAIIAEEKKKVSKQMAKKKLSGKPGDVSAAAKQTREVQASEMASTLANEIDHYKQVQAESAEIANRLSELNEIRQQLRARIIEQL